MARQVADSAIPYAAFGGGEPLQSAHCWEIFDVLADAGVGIKLETDGSRSTMPAPTGRPRPCNAFKSRWTEPPPPPTSAYARIELAAAAAAIAKLVQRGCAGNWFCTHEHQRPVVAAYDAASMGCGVFVTGPLMRIGHRGVDKIARSIDWRSAVDALTKHVQPLETGVALSVYPWDILMEMRKRLESPQAMLLMVPNGKVKLLNALPFAPADLRRDSLDQAWAAYRHAWRSREVREFVLACQTNPQLLTHANETWPMRGH